MGMLEFLFKRKSKEAIKQNVREIGVTPTERLDYLGLAANKKHEALKLIKEKRYDDAWRILHEKKHLLMLHANQHGCNAAQVIAIDGSVHEFLANILRLEGKHDEALVHCVYWIKSSASHGITKKQINKLPAYLNRSSINKNMHKQIHVYAKAKNDGVVDLSAIKSKMSCLFNGKE